MANQSLVDSNWAVHPKKIDSLDFSNLRVAKLYFRIQGSEDTGTDQLCSQCTADGQLWFLHKCEKESFLMKELNFSLQFMINMMPYLDLQ